MRETTLTPNDFILPLFVSEKIKSRRAISSMPGVEQL
ncbi:MAG TPA: porphobilinogen synthase, partial [Chthoniobacterales bacterium]